jgi:16S rRNA (guanine966-N2)-methyltransferase
VSVTITGGQWAGRRLQVPKGDGVRPTTGRVRESLLAKLGPVLAGAWVLDGFAGSGVIGLECLSRGAEQLVAVERSAVHARCLRSNLERLGVSASTATVVVGPLQRYLAKPLPAEHPGWDVVYLDPPYAFDGWTALLAQLVVHHRGCWPATTLLEVASPVWAEQLAAVAPVADVWHYGNTTVVLVKPSNGATSKPY